MILLLLIASIVVLYMFPPIYNTKERNVHVSIDDCIDCFEDLKNNQGRYESLFSQPLFLFLRQLHDDYGGKFTLYCFKEKVGFDMSQVPSKYYSEFSNNSDWLRIAFHGIRGMGHKPEELLDNELEKAYSFFCGLPFIYQKASILRLERFFGSSKQIAYLKSKGVKTFLAADDERISYDLDDVANKELIKEGRLYRNGINYLRTNIRIENIIEPYVTLIKINIKDTLVIFTHEWKLNIWNKYKLRRMIRLLKYNHYMFIN